MLKAIHAHEDLEEAREKAARVIEKLKSMKLGKAAETVRSGVEETLTFNHFPHENWRRIRTNNPLERNMKEIRRRTRVIGTIPDGNSALMLFAAQLRHIAGTKCGTKRYLDISPLTAAEREEEKTAAALTLALGGRDHVEGAAGLYGRKSLGTTLSFSL